jgi:hypothetical protein
MQKPITYERRGQMYRQLTIRNKADAVSVARRFRAESDVWLKKILASKLIAVVGLYECGVSEAEVREVLECRIK